MFPGRLLHCLLLIGCLVLASCTIPDPLEDSTQPSLTANTPATDQTPAAAAPSAVTAAPTDAQAATAAPANVTAVATNAPVASAAPANATPGASADATAGPVPMKGTITVAFDTFPTYFPALIMDAQGLLKQRGYDLKLIPFLLDGQHNYAEPERYARLQSSEFDVLATTLENFALYADPQIGAVTTVIDESAGVDKLVAKPNITSINDLKGKRVAFSEKSVGEYFLYYALNLAGMTPADITPVPKETVADAVQAYLNNEADALSAWEPDVRLAEEQGSRVLITSNELRTILDVLVTSRQSIDTKPDAVQAFHDAWFEALRLMIDDPAAAGQVIVEWGNADWTFIGQAPDLAKQLAPLAQATLGANQVAFQAPEVLQERLRVAHDVWTRTGNTTVTLSDPAQLVDGRFVLQTATQPQLFSTQPPANASFLLASQPAAAPVAAGEAGSDQVVVELPLTQVDFEPETTRLSLVGVESLQQILPVLRASSLYLQIQGGAAWPGPEGRYTEADIAAFANQRAVAVRAYLAQQGIDPNRLIIGETLPAQCPNCLDEAAMVQDRIVRFELLKGGR